MAKQYKVINPITGKEDIFQNCLLSIASDNSVEACFSVTLRQASYYITLLEKSVNSLREKINHYDKFMDEYDKKSNQ